MAPRGASGVMSWPVGKGTFESAWLIRGTTSAVVANSMARVRRSMCDVFIRLLLLLFGNGCQIQFHCQNELIRFTNPLVLSRSAGDSISSDDHNGIEARHCLC